MKKLLFVVLISGCTLFTASAQSQSGAKVSLGIDVGAPTGQGSQVYNFVLGGSLKIAIPTKSPQFQFVITTGYTSFMIKDEYKAYGAEDGKYLPLEVGGKYFFNNNVYFEGDLGTSFDLNQYYTGNKVEFMYSPVLGFFLPAKDGSGLDIGVKYEGRSQTSATLSQVGLRVAYQF